MEERSADSEFALKCASPTEELVTPMTVVEVDAIEAGTAVDLNRVTVVADDPEIDEAVHLVDEKADLKVDRHDGHQDDRQEDLLDTHDLDLVPAKTQTVVSGRKRLSCACFSRLFSLYFTWGHITMRQRKFGLK